MDRKVIDLLAQSSVIFRGAAERLKKCLRLRDASLAFTA